MTLVQLRYFVAIADAGFNITSAAEHVHATQPGLSKQLKQLEDELGFLLFVGLCYLTLSPTAATLSGGEGQRIRMSSKICSRLTGVL